MTDFSRGSVLRAARDEYADRLSKEESVREPFGVATRRVQEWTRTTDGRATIQRLAAQKVERGPDAFGGPDPVGDWKATRRALRTYRMGHRAPRRSLFSRLRGRM